MGRIDSWRFLGLASLTTWPRVLCRVGKRGSAELRGGAMSALSAVWVKRWIGKAVRLRFRPAWPAAAFVAVLGLGLVVAPGSIRSASAAVAVDCSALERASVGQATAAAAACGKAIEVTGLRSETARHWAQPDGSVSAEVFLGPEWVRD